MVIDKQKAYRNLKKTGFIDSYHKSSDHLYLEFYHNGRLVLYTKISHGSHKDLEIFLIRQMASQCKLSNADFTDLCNCPLSKEDYKKKLSEQGLLT